MDRRVFLRAAVGGLPLLAGCESKLITHVIAPTDDQWDDLTCICPYGPRQSQEEGEIPVDPPVVRWGKRDLAYCIVNRDKREIRPAFWDYEVEGAFRDWSAVCDLTFERVGDPEIADILMGAAKGPEHFFDGPRGILAWAYLPTSDNFQGRLVSMFDKDERWSLSPYKEGSVFFRAVVAHEIGHLLGLRHSIEPTALMFPYYRPSLWTPQEVDDISRIRDLYPEDYNPRLAPDGK